MNDEKLRKLGTPDIEIAGLQIWIHSRQFPDSDDYWDGNWVNVSVHCGKDGSSCWANGPIIHLPELEAWMGSIKVLYEKTEGNADLECIEPELAVSIKSQSRGRLQMIVDISINIEDQEHRFYFDIDQSYLPDLLSGCKHTLNKYPIKNAQKQ